MQFSAQEKPIIQIKTNATKVVGQISEQRELIAITQNGEGRAVLQDVQSFEEA